MLFAFPVFSQKHNEVRAWITQNAVPIETVVAGHGFEDLMPLKAILKDKRIVAMGEATHGSKEFFQMKHRMLEFLVSECGFNLFAIESNFAECLVINDYVLGGDGDPKEALKGIYFWTWNTEEVLAMIKWMRQWNLDHPEGKPLLFTGFDMQFTQGSAQVLRTFLEKERPGMYQQYQNELAGMAENKLYQSSDSVKLSWERAAENIDKQLRDQTQLASSDFPAEEYEMVLMHARICRQATQRIGKRKLNMRDSCMAANTRFILEEMGGKDSKIMLWAHNGHLRKKPYDLGYKPQGWYLKELYKEEIYTIGFDFGEGILCAYGVGNFSNWTTQAPRKGSLGAIFRPVPYHQFFVDFHSAEKDPEMAKFFNSKHYQRSIGAVYHLDFPDNFYIHEKPRDLYDGMIFVQKTTAARNLRGNDQFSAWIRRKIKLKEAQHTSVRFSAKVKIVKATPNFAVHLLYSENQNKVWYSTGKTNKSDSLRNREWETVSVSGTTGAFAGISLGMMLKGDGTVLLDDLKIEYQKNGEWQEYPLKNAGFEEGECKSVRKNWNLLNEVYHYEISSEDPASGDYCMKITFDNE